MEVVTEAMVPPVPMTRTWRFRGRLSGAVLMALAGDEIIGGKYEAKLYQLVRERKVRKA